MKVNIFNTFCIGLLFGSIFGSDQAITPVYPANVPAPTAEPVGRQPSARTQEYKQAFKSEKLKASPLLWEGSWLQRKWQNMWRRIKGLPSARQTDYEIAYAPRRQAQHYGYRSLLSAYQDEARRDMDIAEAEYEKARKQSDQAYESIRVIDTAKFKNLAEAQRLLEQYPYPKGKMERLDTQYEDLVKKRAALEKDSARKSKEAIWRAEDYGTKYGAWSKMLTTP